jgi:hypothetical protein
MKEKFTLKSLIFCPKNGGNLRRRRKMGIPLNSPFCKGGYRGIRKVE